jgi:mannose-binding lectin 2
MFQWQPITPSAFEIEFEFRVDGKSNNLYGDGFAMWLTKDRAQFGPVFGSSGTPLSRHDTPKLALKAVLADRWDGLGIMFDTYANSRHSVRLTLPTSL